MFLRDYEDMYCPYVLSNVLQWMCKFQLNSVYCTYKWVAYDLQNVGHTGVAK